MPPIWHRSPQSRYMCFQDWDCINFTYSLPELDIATLSATTRQWQPTSLPRATSRIDVYKLVLSIMDWVTLHDDVIKWKHFPRYWPSVRGIHRPTVSSPRKDQWRGALMFPLFCAWINDWVNNHKASDLRRHRAHYDVTVMDMGIWYHILIIGWSSATLTLFRL